MGKVVRVKRFNYRVKKVIIVIGDEKVLLGSDFNGLVGSDMGGL